jgi:chloramphenicol-sensitive protein RarD
MPVFWKFLGGVSVFEVTAHRVLWSLAVVAIVLLYRGSLMSAFGAFKDPRTLAIHGLAAACLIGNWLLYVWAMMTDRVLEGALGYYLNPFLYLLLGCLVLGEKHTRLQFVSIAIAMVGVVLQFPAISGVPWLAIGLASTFAVYGTIKKQSSLGSFSGLAVETIFLAPVALAFCVFLTSTSRATFGADFVTTILLVATGLVTAAPLLLFARGAKSITLSLLGILQFIGPTGQFLLGWLRYDEPLPPLRLASFALIWTAVVVYIVSLRTSSRRTNG